MTNTAAASTASNTSTSSAASARSRLSSNMDTFLTLLTTQLKNQSPMDPLDTNQFTQQLVQFSQVEQQISSNDQLGKLVSLMQTSQLSASLGYIGKKVTFDSSQSTATASGATWNFDPPESGKYTVRVRDSEGNVVAEREQTYTAGTPASFSWDGKRTDGKAVGSDPYTLELRRGTSAVNVVGSGTVSRVDLEGDTTQLTIGGQKVPSGKVRSISL